MDAEVKNEDLLSLAKEQVRLTKWLIGIVAVQGIFIVTIVSIFLWMFIQPLLAGRGYY